MAQIDTDISNGTCYWSSGEVAPDRFIPCGNAADGQKSCCESQDMCLSSNACYNAQYGVTYLAGCTDHDYNDSSCPIKADHSNQTWVGLVYCNGTSNEWTGCAVSDETVTSPEPCWCPSTSRSVLFRDASRLDDVVSLPASQGGSVTWQGGHGPFAPTVATRTSSSSTTSAGVGVTSSNTIPPTTVTSTSSELTPTGSTPPTTVTSTSSEPTPTGSTPHHDKGLSTGAKAGIGVGVGLAVLGLLVAFLILFRRYKRKQAAKLMEKDINSAQPQSYSREPKPDDHDLRSPAWSGHKSELPGTESVTSPTTPHAFTPNQSKVYMNGNERDSTVSGSTRLSSAISPMGALSDTRSELPGSDPAHVVTPSREKMIHELPG